jgi:hypothetical protein
MKKIITLTILLFTIGCTSNEKATKSKAEIEKEYHDSIEMEINVQKKMDEYDEKLKNAINWDTVGVYKSGLIIKKARFVSEEYSNYKSVQLSYTNKTGKKIKAIKFKWYGINSFNEPADCGNYSEIGFGGGFDDDGLGINKSTTSTWDVLSNDGDKIVKAWAYQISFEDGTNWKSETNSNFYK